MCLMLIRNSQKKNDFDYIKSSSITVSNNYNLPLDYRFFIKFYEKSYDYQMLFEKIGNIENFIYAADDHEDIGLVSFLGKIKRQFNFYANHYLKLHNLSTEKPFGRLKTIVDDDGAPITYRTYHSFNLCIENMDDVPFRYFNDEYGNNEIKTFKKIKRIKTLSLTYNQSVKSLGSINYVEQNVYIYNSLIKDLGNLEHVNEDLSIHFSENLNSFGKLKFVGRNLNLRGSHINSIKNITIKGDLILNRAYENNFEVENCKIGGKIKFAYHEDFPSDAILKTRFPQEFKRVKERREITKKRNKEKKERVKANKEKLKNRIAIGIFDCKTKKFVTLNKMSDLVGKKITWSNFGHRKNLYGRYVHDEDLDNNKVFKQWKDILDLKTNKIERHNLKSFSERHGVKENNVWKFFNGKQKKWLNRYILSEIK